MLLLSTAIVMMVFSTYFADGAGRGQVTCPRSHSNDGLEPGSTWALTELTHPAVLLSDYTSAGGCG